MLWATSLAPATVCSPVFFDPDSPDVFTVSRIRPPPLQNNQTWWFKPVKTLNEVVSCYKSMFVWHCLACKKRAASLASANVCSSYFSDNLTSRHPGGFYQELNYPQRSRPLQNKQGEKPKMACTQKIFNNFYNQASTSPRASPISFLQNVRKHGSEFPSLSLFLLQLLHGK